MRRRAPDEHVRPFRERATWPEGEALRRRLAAWVSRHADDIPEAPELPTGVTDRPAGLLGAAHRCRRRAPAAHGRPRPQRGVAIVKDTTAADDQSLGVRLLSDIRMVFGTDGRLATATLLERLAAVDDAPWCKQLDGRSDKARRLVAREEAQALRDLAKGRRIGADHPRGYDAQDFADAWRRCASATPPGDNATNAQTRHPWQGCRAGRA